MAIEKILTRLNQAMSEIDDEMNGKSHYGFLYDRVDNERKKEMDNEVTFLKQKKEELKKIKKDLIENLN